MHTAEKSGAPCAKTKKDCNEFLPSGIFFKFHSSSLYQGPSLIFGIRVYSTINILSSLVEKFQYWKTKNSQRVRQKRSFVNPIVREGGKGGKRRHDTVRPAHWRAYSNIHLVITITLQYNYSHCAGKQARQLPNIVSY